MCSSETFLATFSDLLHSYEGVSSCTKEAVSDGSFLCNWRIVRGTLKGNSSFTYCSFLHPVCRVPCSTTDQTSSSFPVPRPRDSPVLRVELKPEHPVVEIFFTISDLSFLEQLVLVQDVSTQTGLAAAHYSDSRRLLLCVCFLWRLLALRVLSICQWITCNNMVS